MRTSLLVAVLAAIAARTVLAGSGIERVLVHLPARRRIGPVAYADYVRATDLHNGRAMYPVLGLTGVAATWIALALSLTTEAATPVQVLLGVAAGCEALGVLATIRSVPVMLRLGRAQNWDQGGEAEIAALLDRLAHLSAARAAFLALSYGALLGALVIR
jgi:hypothetical protein